MSTDSEKKHKEILEAFEQTHPEVRAAIMNLSIDEKMIALGKKFALHVDQMGQLERIVADILLGFTPASQMLDSIKTQLHVNDMQASEIAADINTKLFEPLREFLKEHTQLVREVAQNPHVNVTPAQEDPVDAASIEKSPESVLDPANIPVQEIPVNTEPAIERIDPPVTDQIIPISDLNPDVPVITNPASQQKIQIGQNIVAKKLGLDVGAEDTTTLVEKELPIENTQPTPSVPQIKNDPYREPPV